MKRPVAYFLRHGETTLNAEDRFRGPELDPPIDTRGRMQAMRAKQILPPHGTVYHSDLTRTRQTANIVSPSKGPGIPVPDLRSLNIGNLAGKQKSQANLDKLNDIIRNPRIRIPGGESLNDFRGRVTPMIKMVAEEGRVTGTPPLVVTHSSVIHEVGNVFNGDHNSARVLPGGIAVVESDDDGRLSARALYRPDESEEDA